jgi:hypothetical protein
MRFFRSASLVVVVSAAASVNAFAQAPPLVFTVAAPEPASAALTVSASPIVEERGLALWGGASSDFGVGVDVVGRGWTVRSIASMTRLPVGSDSRPTFQQVELLRPVLATASMSVAVGGGIRQEWDGTHVLIGRAVAGANVAGGRLQGSFVLERSESSPIRRDAADVVTSVGWSRRIGDRLGVGVEGVGQDLEGFWNPSEAEGGAKLLVGPSVHLRSKSGRWTATATGGPVLRSSSVMSPDVSGVTSRSGGRHYGIFASASWLLPSRR